MIYPTITDNFELDTWNANFAEVSTKTSYTPTARNLIHISEHFAMVKNGVARYKLSAICGDWTSGISCNLTTLTSNYIPLIRVEKEILLRDGCQARFSIKTNGRVDIELRTSISNSTILIDETYLL